ncbi:MAG: hypothetical protein HYS34_05665 [Acidobacteria bacterium]|nr:hypothetical protein [Acidobacteriota bacterium]
MSTATLGRPVHKPAAKRPPAVPGGTDTIAPTAPAAPVVAGALPAEMEDLGKRYATVLCCTLDTETK